ncbi:hypothetical protein LTEGF4_12460 [Limnohabitans sp. TEGF004]|nr:hypothetical protein LTEGF4_12460 [Limnohabitans sp. TEGF004]
MVVTDALLAWVMAPLALSKMSPLAPPVLVSKLAFTLMVLAYTEMGPLMLVKPPIVTVSVRVVLTVSLPIVSPVTPEETAKSVMGHVTVELKLSL